MRVSSGVPAIALRLGEPRASITLAASGALVHDRMVNLGPPLSYMAWWDVCDLTVTDGEEAYAFLERQVDMYNNWGTHAWVRVMVWSSQREPEGRSTAPGLRSGCRASGTAMAR